MRRGRLSRGGGSWPEEEVEEVFGGFVAAAAEAAEAPLALALLAAEADAVEGAAGQVEDVLELVADVVRVNRSALPPPPGPGPGPAAGPSPPLSPVWAPARPPRRVWRALAGSFGSQSSSCARSGKVPFGQTDGWYLGNPRSSLIPGWFGPSQVPHVAISSNTVVRSTPPGAPSKLSIGTPGSPVSKSWPLENDPQGPLKTSCSPMWSVCPARSNWLIPSVW